MIKKAMVMAAGVGSRLDPLTQKIPKPLVPVLNKPVMDILLQKLKDYGIEKVIANTHYLAEKIQDRYASQKVVDIDFSYVNEDELSGTAGGVKKCEFFFEDVDDFIVVSADGLHDADIGKIVKSHLESIGYKAPIVCPMSAKAGLLLKQYITGQKLSDTNKELVRSFCDMFYRDEFDLSSYYYGNDIDFIPTENVNCDFEIPIAKLQRAYEHTGLPQFEKTLKNIMED